MPCFADLSAPAKLCTSAAHSCSVTRQNRVSCPPYGRCHEAPALWQASIGPLRHPSMGDSADWPCHIRSGRLQARASKFRAVKGPIQLSCGQKAFAKHISIYIQTVLRA